MAPGGRDRAHRVQRLVDEGDRGGRVNGPIGLRTAVLLFAGGGATYVAFQHPTFDTALLGRLVCEGGSRS